MDVSPSFQTYTAEANRLTSPVSLRSLPFRLRVLALIFLTLILSSLFIILLPNDEITIRHVRMMLALRHMGRSRQEAFFANIDGNVPFNTSLKITDSLHKYSANKIGILLFPVGECSSCLSVDLRKISEEAEQNHLLLVLLTSANHVEAQKFLKNSKFNAFLLFDPDQSISKSLKTMWLGRPYLFSLDGHLQWYQQTSRVNSDPFHQNEFLEKLTKLRGVQQ